MKLCWIKGFNRGGLLVIPSISNCKLELIEGCSCKLHPAGEAICPTWLTWICFMPLLTSVFQQGNQKHYKNFYSLI